jgi:nicotinate-nucleotide adenylyltransferase
MNIGLFGGSFNPIHNGHVRLAKSLLQEAALDEVWFLVSPQNPFKQDQQLLDDDKRLQLVRLALKEEPQLMASDFEFHLPKPSYTWNTLQALEQEYPERKFTLLIGGDNWEAFDKWYRYEDILKRYPIIVYPREGSKVPGVKFQGSEIQIVETPLINISSTQIRQRLHEGKSVRGLVNTEVAMVIEQEHLYR